MEDESKKLIEKSNPPTPITVKVGKYEFKDLGTIEICCCGESTDKKKSNDD